MKIKAICSLFIISIVSLALTTCDMFGTINATISGFNVSMQVNNRAAGRAAIGSEDTVELYLEELWYIHDGFDQANNFGVKKPDGNPDGGFIQIIARGIEAKGFEDRSGWYDASTREWPLQTLPFSGMHSSIRIRITKIRINGTDVYDFPNHHNIWTEYGTWAVFGEYNYPENFGRKNFYPDNFSGVDMPGPGSDKKPDISFHDDGVPNVIFDKNLASTASLLETILTIEPDIIDKCFDPVTKKPLLDFIDMEDSGYDSVKDPYTYIKIQGIAYEL